MASKPKISERALEVRDARGNGGNGHHNLPVPMEPPADLMEFADEQAGHGASTSSEDRLVPLIYVLHYQSPQVMKDDARYIEDAEPGDIWLRNAPKGMEIISGREGVLVQPCFFYRDVGEWVPRSDGGGGGQGFKGRHPYEKPEQVPGARPHHDGNPFHWTTADGYHDLVETRNHAVLVYHPSGRVMPYLIPFTSTGHAASRAWMTLITNQMITSGKNKGKLWNSYARLYRLTTESRKNDKGKWFSIVAEEGQWCNVEQYEAGKKLAMQFESGERVAAEPESIIENDPTASAPGQEAGDPGPSAPF